MTSCLRHPNAFLQERRQKKMKYRITFQLILFFVFTGFLLHPMSTSAQVNLPDFIESMDIKGDLRVRYDYQDLDEAADNDPKDRLRLRFRMGVAWHNPAENWKIAAGLATGGASGNTTNATFSNDAIFETGDIRLDYAYAEHSLKNF